MSYGSTFVPFEPHGKISARHTRVRRDTGERPTPRLVHYEKEFDVNLSRLEEPPPSRSSIRDSMLAYSKKMKSLQDARHPSGGAGSSSGTASSGAGDKLFVRAKHIPKYPIREPKKRRPMSFDELLGRDRETGEGRPQGAKQRPLSDKTKPSRDGEKRSDTETRLPLLTERLKKAGQIQVSLVSASDLYDIVDFSLKSKGTKSDSLRLLQMEKESRAFGFGGVNSGITMADGRLPPDDVYNKFERTNKSSQQDFLRRDRYSFLEDADNHVPDADFYEQTFALANMADITPRQERKMNSNMKLPSLNPSEPIKRRPNRAKRMRLVDSMLGDIPEDKVFFAGGNSNEIDYHSRRVISPPPKHSSVNPSDSTRHSLDSIEENVEYGLWNKSKPQSDITNAVTCQQRADDTRDNVYVANEDCRSVLPVLDEAKVTKKILIRDDGDVRIEVTQCPPKNTPLNAKQKAQKKFKKLIYLRDGSR